MFHLGDGLNLKLFLTLTNTAISKILGKYHGSCVGVRDA